LDTIINLQLSFLKQGWTTLVCHDLFEAHIVKQIAPFLFFRIISIKVLISKPTTF